MALLNQDKRLGKRLASLDRILKAHVEARKRNRDLAVKAARGNVDEVLRRALDLRQNVNMEMPPVGKSGEKKSVFSSKRSFVEALTKRGFVAIGNGMYSQVLAKPGSDRVIKVGAYDSWIDYVLWAHKAGYGGTFAPKVYSYKSYSGATEQYGNTKFYVAVMERLDKTLRQVPREHDYKYLHQLFEQAVGYKHRMSLTLADLAIPGLGRFATDFTIANDKDLFSGLDLHGGNFMLRSDGSLVLTDPVAGQPKTQYKRLRLQDLSPEVKLAA